METPQNGDYIAPEEFKASIEGFDEALLGHTFLDEESPVLIYSVDLMLDILEANNPMASEAQLDSILQDIFARYQDKVIFLFT